MDQGNVISATIDQFQRALTMFRDAVAAFPADEWRKGKIDYLRPAGVAYHVLEAIDFYMGDQHADKFPWGGRFGTSWEERDSSKLPSQAQLLEYLDEMEEKLETWLERTALLAPERLFPHTGPTSLARALYVLRHTHHHVAEMSLELTRRGLQSPDWR